jgi:hypothetical protein
MFCLPMMALSTIWLIVRAVYLRSLLVLLLAMATGHFFVAIAPFEWRVLGWAYCYAASAIVMSLTVLSFAVYVAVKRPEEDVRLIGIMGAVAFAVTVIFSYVLSM